MKKLLLICMLLLDFTSAHAQQDSVEQPAVKVGDRWAYERRDLLTGLVTQTSTVEVIAVEADMVRTRNTTNDSGVTEDNVYDAQGNARHVDGRSYTPFRQFYSFPMHVGKTWASKVVYPNQRGDSQIHAEMRGTVVGWESVTVPAGSFKALKVVVDQPYFSDRRIGSGGRGVGRHTIWYAPEVRRFVQLDYHEGSNQIRVLLTKFQVQ